MAYRGTNLMARYIHTPQKNQLDSHWQGDDLSCGKESQMTRVMFHNVNGLQLHGADGMPMFVNEQAQLGVDVQGITEHCLDTTKFYVNQTAQELIRHQYTGPAALQLHSSTEPAINIYKPGGTGMLLLGEVVSRQESQGRGGDPMGRWSYVHLRRQESPPLTIITAYQVCPRPTNIIGNTAYHQQVRALSAAGAPTLHPRQAFIRDMCSFITMLTSQGHDIILGGDFNESLEDKNSGILRLVTTCNLIDPFLHRFPQHQQFGTHALGSRRIDYVFITSRLLSSMTKIGYAPFQYAKPSDHRPLLLEFKTKALFGYIPDVLHNVRNRIVKSTDKKVATRFISRWFQEISDRQGFSLQHQLDNDETEASIVEQLDEIIGTSGDIAERACRGRRPEFYSQLIVQQRLTVSILRGHLQSLRLAADRTSQLKRRMQRGGIDFPLPTTIRFTLEALRQASSNLHQSCKNHATLREQELTAKIELATQNGNRSKAQILRAIKKSEDHRKTYQILQKMKRKTTESNTIDRIEIPASWPAPYHPLEEITDLEDPKTCSHWRMVTNPAEVEYYLLLRNQLHFGQAEGTPFTQAPLSQDIDWAASTIEAEQLLNGTYAQTIDIPHCDDLLRECRQATTLDSLPAELTLEEFRGKIKAWKESTTTSPSGRHLGRYKSLFAPCVVEEEATEGEEVPIPSKQNAIASLILSVINYCIRHTYVLTRWTKVVNVMIFKEQSNYKIHRLRVIHIYEADFNLLLAVKWRQLLRKADEGNLIHEGQYGGRPGCEAQSLTLLEELKYDLSYLTRRTMFNFDNDATSCYDRIVVPFASVINRKYGLHRNVVGVHAKTLQSAKYYLKTACGISTHHYTTCTEYPIHGTGQGSGNSPCIWLFISSTLFQVHQSQGFGASFVSPDGNHRVHLSMVGFVDDSTGTVNDFQPNSEANLPELIRRMQYDARLWNQLLYCSGGKLELQKCSFHVLRFDFQPNGTPIPAIDAYDQEIYVTDPITQEEIPIPSKRSFEPHKTLGHYKSPTSRLQQELKSLQSKADRIALLISISPLTRSGAFLAYNTIYNPSIRYTLPQCFFDRQVLEKAQASSMQKLISKCGFNRNTARAIMVAPRSYAGAGFLPWYLMQGEGQILQFMKHWRTNTLISKTLKIAVLWAQWQAGISISILEDPNVPLPYLECRWITSLRNFLSHLDASLLVTTILVPPPERTNDIYIMDYARSCGLFTDKDLAILNYCRLYLHVTTVSELFDASGERIIPELFRCRREAWFNPSTVISLQQRPSDHQIRTKWQKLCRQWSTDDGRIGASFTLGTWKIQEHHLRRWRQSYVDRRAPGTLYHWQNSGYWEYIRDSLHGNVYHLSKPSRWLPNQDSLPVDVLPTDNAHVSLISPSRVRWPTITQSRISRTFQEYINTLEPWEISVLAGVHLLQPPYELFRSLEQLSDDSQLLIVSDGSKQETTISYGWVIGSDDGTVYAQHCGFGTGEATSHRAEGWGMLSAAKFLEHLFKFTTSPQDSYHVQAPFVFLSDNSGLIHRVNQRLQYQHPYPSATLAPDWDVVEQITQVIRQLPHDEVSIQWVKGHQDDEAVDLSIEAKYNILADELADRAFKDLRFHDRLSVSLPASKCSLFIKHEMLQGHYQRRIREAYSLPGYKSYVAKRHGWTQLQCQQIDWMVFSRAATNFCGNPVQLTKLVHGKLPTNAELAKSQPGYSAKCHYCNDNETFYHLLQCSNEQSLTFRSVIVESVVSYMNQRSINATFQQAIVTCLENSLLPEDPPNSTCLQQCVDDQRRFGTSTFLKGFLSLTWRHTLTQIFPQSEQTVIDLLSGLLRIVWSEQLKFWESHLKSQHQAHQQTSLMTNQKLEYYRLRVRQLHMMKDKCLHAHQGQYFYPDVEEYLSSATASQLRQYIHHYEKAILASSQEATQQQSRTLWMFPGFHRRIANTTVFRPPQEIPTNMPTAPHHNRNIGARGAPSHHKHTRWRPLSTTMTSIRNFFHTNTKLD